MKLSRMDLNLLVALDALLTERNVTRAGERISLSQPAMSGALARLREMFRDELLVRVGRHLELTPLAQELAAPVRGILEQIELTIEGRRGFDPGSEKRSFVIAASDYAVLLLGRPLLARLHREAPGISVRFVQLPEHLFENLALGEIDFLVVPAETRPNYPGRLLFTDRWVCAVWSGNHLVGDRLTRKQFIALPHLAYRFGRRLLFSTADRYVSSLGLPIKIAATTESFVAAPFMLEGTDMVTLTHRRLARRLEEAANIRYFPPPFRIPDIHESIFWNPRNTASPAHVWLRTLLIESATAL
jgi:LysR family nod box-dependent transcriptional activator